MPVPKRVSRWWSYIEFAARAMGLDPYLVAAILDRESLGGDALVPKGAAGTGDGGHGRGLMQLDDRYHASFIAAVGPDGRPLWQKPLWNLLYAAELLAVNVRKFDGDELPAIAAYNASPARVSAALSGAADEADKIRRLDAVTTGGNYVSNILARREIFKK